MRKSSLSWTLLGVALAGGIALADETLPSAKSLLARNLEARGGAARWRDVRALELSGTFDAWSAPVDMKIQRARPRLFRFDHTLFGAPATLAYDGNAVWISSAALGAAEPATLDEAWKRNVAEDAALVNRLQTLAEADSPVELLGRGDVDGTAAWRLRVVPSDGPPEIWFLDVTSGLELKRESLTFDVFSGAIEMPMETYWSDFRTVDGIKVPFREERHFGTRYHVYVVKTARINPPLDPARFAAPKPPAEVPPHTDEQKS